MLAVPRGNGYDMRRLCGVTPVRALAYILRRYMNFEMCECERCHETFPRTDKHFSKDKRHGTYRRVCKKCEAALKRENRVNNKLLHGQPKPWTFLYNTKLRSQLYHDHVSVCCLDPYTLMAIMSLQGHSDCITRIHFRLPEPEEMIAFKSWKDWIKSLSRDDQANTPVLVRIVGDIHGEWVRGNVVFVSAPFGDMIEQFGGLRECKDACSRLLGADLRIAQPHSIDEEVIRVKTELDKQNKIV